MRAHASIYYLGLVATDVGMYDHVLRLMCKTFVVITSNIGLRRLVHNNVCGASTNREHLLRTNMLKEERMSSTLCAKIRVENIRLVISLTNIDGFYFLVWCFSLGQTLTALTLFT